MVRILKDYLTIAGAIPLMAWLAYACLANRALAQITPDTSLGNENSVVTPNVDVKGELADLIEGGAIRDINLFHSFLEFNVENGGRVYFANPAGIENILTRVTGNNVSNILGTLGVDGAANLFLLNPNGIVFGNNAQLDVEGSFLGSTTNSLVFGDGSEFSATNPNQPPLLKVSTPLGLQYGANPTGDIVNSGNLAVGQDLTLAGNNLDLQGQLLAGGDLKLQAEDTLKIRDNLDNPFIAAAGGELVVQGNQVVDIFALNHPESGLFSGGNLILRSPNSIGGDAHYWSGGSFRIEKLDGSLGNLESPYDPVIRSFGDVSFNTYQGASLHILAGGSVNIGTARITGPETGSVGDNFLVEEITLSDGTLVSINGGEKPTLDVRAGVSAEAIGTPGITGLDGFPTDFFADAGFNFLEPPPETNTAATSADITIGDAFILAPDGLVLLTNQYQPNGSLPGGDINIIGAGLLGFGIFTANDQGNAGDVILDSRQNIAVTNSDINSSFLGDDNIVADAGNITLLAQEEVSLTNGFISADNFGAGEGGDITISTKRLVADGAIVSTSTPGEATGGSLRIFASESVTLKGISTNNELPSALLAGTLGTGDAGEITINTKELIMTDEARVFVATSGEGAGGIVTIETEKLLITDGAQVLAITYGEGNGGELKVFASESVQVIGTTADGEFPTGLSSESQGKGDAGDLTIETGKLLIADGAQVTAGSDEEGKGGELKVFASEEVQVIGESADGDSLSNLSAQSQGKGDAGNLTISTPRLLITDGAQVGVSTFADGAGGSLIIDATELVEVSGNSADGERISVLNAQAEGTGDAGNLTINTPRLLITDGAQVGAGTDGAGKGGEVRVFASEQVQVIGTSANGEFTSSLSVQTQGTGDAGDLTIETGKLLIADGANVSTSTFAQGDGGELKVFASEEVQMMGRSANGKFATFLSSQSATGSTGNAGDLTIKTQKLLITDGGNVSAGTFAQGDGGELNVFASEEVQVIGESADGEFPSALGTQSQGKGDAGSLTIETEKLLIAEGGLVSTATFEDGEAGNLTIQAKELLLTDSAQVSARSQGKTPAGDININVEGLLSATDGEIITDAEQSAGGAINITAQDIRLFGDSDIKTNVFSGDKNGGDINITADSIIAFDDSDILAFARDGKGGDITFNTVAFFGENYRPAPEGTDPETLDGNNVVDINASGRTDGVINLPDVSFIQNSLTDLQEELVNPDSLIAGSCIIPTNQQQVSLYITGAGGLPTRPGDVSVAPFPTGIVQPIGSSDDSAESVSRTNRQWQKGDPIIEPTGVYQLSNGRLVMGRECSRK
ncbi:MAG: filamentous hemagglutinin N-terminal domain-containing protein [Symploca sp. SIO2E9]|nr:filamentous hemagglutinin N-terminal domain-containing protein [Symploca sp. SIO2E9]